MNIILCGSMGRMGRAVKTLCENRGERIVGEADIRSGEFCNITRIDAAADVIIDFSSHMACEQNITYAVKRKIPIVVAVTGHTEEEVAMIEDAGREIPVFFSPNLSFGMTHLIKCVADTVKAFPGWDIEIIEKHYGGKLDSPSGSAEMICGKIAEIRPGIRVIHGRNGQRVRDKNEVCVHSVRCGNIPAQHEIILSGSGECIRLSHEVFSGEVFAHGALTAAEFIIKCKSGIYNMFDLTEGKI